MDPINEEVEPTTVPESAGTNDKKIQKSGILSYKLKGESQWQTGKVLCWAGKATGNYKDQWNVESESKEVKAVDFARDVTECPRAE